ncbi:MAG: LysE family translocator [Anaerolineales bacterium]|nr:LysE family translocator [Anaerolineales bacterium]
MPSTTTIGLFTIAALVLLLTPGPAVLYVLARSINQGRRAGLVSVTGLAAGTLIQVLAAALGLSALVLSSALAFHALQYLGAAYLIYLGLRKLLSQPASAETVTIAPRRLSQVFAQGIVVNVLNPKLSLFFLAFLPQFVDLRRGSAPGQMLILGLLFVALALCTDGAYALLAGTLGGWLKRSARFLKAQHYVTGGVYVGLGVLTAVSGLERA